MQLATLAVAIFMVLSTVSAATLGQKRDIDVCAFIYTDLTIDGIDFGILELCVCLDLLDVLIGNNAVTKKAAAKTSHAQVKQALTQKVTSDPLQQQCTYPPNSTPVCTATNPCAFTCNPPYVQSGNNCVLPGSALRRKRDLSTCNYGLTRCGIWSSWGTHAYECVDTAVELESCGGCAVPYGDDAPSGQDCSQIRGVADVECLGGKCRVHQCRRGFIVSLDGTSCTPLGPASSEHASAHAHHIVEDVFQASFGAL